MRRPPEAHRKSADAGCEPDEDGCEPLHSCDHPQTCAAPPSLDHTQARATPPSLDHTQAHAAPPGLDHPRARAASPSLGHPRVHLRRTDSTNDRARGLAMAGAPHGTLVTAGEQSAGRGRQGRRWSAPPGSSLLMSLVLRRSPRSEPGARDSDPPSPAVPASLASLPLLAAVALCDVVGLEARIKWPNDVLLCDRKLAGILVEGRPQQHWAVLGIGVNVAVRIEDLPVELGASAATLGRAPGAIEPFLAALLAALERRLAESLANVLTAWRERDALRGREIAWSGGRGRAAGIDGEGRLLVELPDGSRTALAAGEVHLESAL